MFRLQVAESDRFESGNHDPREALRAPGRHLCPGAVAGPAGNVAAFPRYLRPCGSPGRPVQAKLAIGRHDDPLEAEADRVADLLTAGEDPSPLYLRSVAGAAGSAHRSAVGQDEPAAAPELVGDMVRMAGDPLDPAIRGQFERRLGCDLGAIRVHSDSAAATAAGSIGALAYAAGPHLVFGAGQYAPATNAGRRLIAHEIAHTRQQGAVGASGGAGPMIVQRNGKLPAWTADEIKAGQKELRRLGLYSAAIDTTMGDGMIAGLGEAFGGDGWKTLAAATALAQLKAAKPTPGKKGEHYYRWSEMFKDGMLDMVLGLGFDEAGWHNLGRPKITAALTKRGFADDKPGAIAIYKVAGQTVPKAAFGTFFVKKNAISYSPPVNPSGKARKVDAIVRFVTSPTGAEGKQAASVFTEGMTKSDISFYAGHARYGSGPDFDRNFTFELFDAKGKLEKRESNYGDLEKLLKAEGKPHGRNAWEQYVWREKRGRIKMISSNAGNVVLNKTNPWPKDDFGANLMYSNVKSETLLTGKTGPLAKAPPREYRLMVFWGCTTKLYEKSIRATPGMDSKHVDMLGSTRPLLWGDEADSIGAFLDGVLGQLSAEAIERAMDAEQTGAAGSIKSYGIGDNPVIR
ncbi:MAG TPA: DUF4157 domain-containing protein [Allosphingosinicella sp.]|nr:DUF4157 domain-containing protein [Allosphingosinicella sp.]